MARLKMYVDGFNLYHAIEALNQPKLKWLSPIKLAESYLKHGDTLCGVEFFTSIATDDGNKFKRHNNYLKAIQAVGVRYHKGNFQRVDRICERTAQKCPFKEEKRTDVGIAVHILADAYDDMFDRMVLVTADADQVPTIQHLKRRFPVLHVMVAAPPRRLRIARELCSVADWHDEITPNRLKACLLPRSVRDVSGKLVATMPAIYDQGEPF